MFNLLITKNMSRFHNRNFELLEPYEGKLSRTVLRGESSRKGADLLDKAYYDALKSVHNIIKDARKVKLTLEMVSEITEIYTSGFNRMVSDPNFTVDELAAISAGYARLLEEGGALVAELKTVITGGNGLSLSDKERMDVVDQVYTKMLEYRNLTRYYTRKTISVSFIRSREKGDAHRVLALYGNPNDRYW